MKRPSLAFGLLFLAACMPLSAPLFADDKDSKPAPPAAGPQPNVSIAPRTRATPVAPESVLDRRSDIRVDKYLVPIQVSVTTPDGKYVTALEKENFKLFENNVEQEIISFSTEDVPMSVGIVFDTSGSMGGKLNRSREAVTQFLKTANPEDEFFLIQFNDRPELTVPFTPDTEELQNRLLFTESKGRTALLDGVYMAMNQMKKARNPRKALLIISDGGDNSSAYTESEVKSAVREADVQIYAIGIFEPFGSRGRTPEESNGPGLLTDVTESTGGRHFAVDNLAELPDVAAKIGLELRYQYVLGFTPKNKERDGKYRRVNVKLVKTQGLPPLKALFRPGYNAPSQ
jgi:Ca-activated chloride channel family protein